VKFFKTSVVIFLINQRELRIQESKSQPQVNIITWDAENSSMHSY